MVNISNKCREKFENEIKMKQMEAEQAKELEAQKREQEKLDMEERLKSLKWEPSAEELAEAEERKMILQRILEKREKIEKLREKRLKLKAENDAILENREREYQAAVEEKRKQVYKNGWINAYCYKYLLKKIEPDWIQFQCGLKIQVCQGYDRQEEMGRHIFMEDKNVDELKNFVVKGEEFKILEYPVYSCFDLEICHQIIWGENGRSLYDEIVWRGREYLDKWVDRGEFKGVRF